MEAHRVDFALVLAAREMDAMETTDGVARMAVARCLDLVPGCEFAGISLCRRRGRLESRGVSGPVAARCEAFQCELGEGPGVDVVNDETILVSRNVADDPRWPVWGPCVAREDGIRGVLGVRLFSGAGVHGALTLYARRVASFTPQSLDYAVVLGTHVAAALRNVGSSEHLQAAIDSRTAIGQAQGILMERFGLDAARAFDVLSRISQNGNIRLVDVARRLVERGTLPSAREGIAK